jgi:hypothetical protein
MNDIPEQPVSPTLTAGDIIARLSLVPADTPVIGYVTSPAAVGDDWPGMDGWFNLTDLHFDTSNPDIAVTIEVRDTYDTRQW